MPTYIEQCDRPHHPDRTHVHATRDGYPDTVFYGTPGVIEAHGYPRLRTAWGDERLFSKNPPPDQHCIDEWHPATPHAHTINGLWGSLDAGPGHLRETHPDGSWVVYDKTAPSHSVTRREVHLCEDPTHGGVEVMGQMFPLDRVHTHSPVGWGDPAVPELWRHPRVKDENGEDMLFSCDPLQVTVEFTEPEPTKPEPVVHECTIQHHGQRPHRHSRMNTDPEDRALRMDGLFGAPTTWSAMRPGQHLVVDMEADGSEKRFGKGEHVTAQPEPVIHTVEQCEHSHHPRERHVHTSPPTDGRFGHYWRVHGHSPIAGREDFLIDRHADGAERVFSQVTDDIGTTFTPAPQHALPTTDWEDGGPSE